MGKRLILFVTAINFIIPIYGNIQDIRLARVMIKAREFQMKKDWTKIINIANNLYLWGEKSHAAKCLELAKPLVIAKNSYAGALHIAILYKKIKDHKKYYYWIKVYQRLSGESKKRKWKKY